MNTWIGQTGFLKRLERQNLERIGTIRTRNGPVLDPVLAFRQQNEGAIGRPHRGGRADVLSADVLRDQLLGRPPG